MRTSTAYFAGVGTVVVAIAAGLGGGVILANVMNPNPSHQQMSRLDQHTSPQPSAASNRPDEKAQQQSQAPVKPKVAVAKPQPQKSYALLSDGQIAGIKERLKLSSSQEYYWPAVESALRAVARKLQAEKLSNPNARPSQIDPDSEEVQQLKSAAMPLLFQLREDQKDEVRKLARIIGLEKVAAAI